MPLDYIDKVTQSRFRLIFNGFLLQALNVHKKGKLELITLGFIFILQTIFLRLSLFGLIDIELNKVPNQLTCF